MLLLPVFFLDYFLNWALMVIAQRISSHCQPGLSCSLSEFGIEITVVKNIYTDIRYICINIRIYILYILRLICTGHFPVSMFCLYCWEFQPDLEQSVLSPERDPPEAEMRLCNPLFQRCCRSSATLPPLLGQPSISAAPLQSHLTAENTWLRLTLISFPADSCLTGTQTSFVISCVRLQLPPPPSRFLILLVLKGPLILFLWSWVKKSVPPLCLEVWWKSGKCVPVHTMPSFILNATCCNFFSSSFATSWPTWKCTYSTLHMPVPSENVFSGFFSGTSSCPTGCKHGLSLLLYLRSRHIYITTHATQTFQNTVSLFISLSDKVKRRVSGPTPPAGLGWKGHLRSRVLFSFFFACFCQEY